MVRQWSIAFPGPVVSAIALTLGAVSASGQVKAGTHVPASLRRHALRVSKTLLSRSEQLWADILREMPLNREARCASGDCQGWC